MAREPDNLVLQMLRDIRTTLDEHSRMHAEHSKSLAEIRDELKTNNQNATYAAGFALLARRDVDTTSMRVEKVDQRLDRLEERVSRVEAKLES